MQDPPAIDISICHQCECIVDLMARDDEVACLKTDLKQAQAEIAQLRMEVEMLRPACSFGSEEKQRCL